MRESTIPKRERNPDNAVTEIEAKCSKKQEIQDAKSKIYYI